MSDRAASEITGLHQFSDSILPILAPGAPYLLQTLSNTESNLEEVAGVVEGFPSVAMRLIALANSGWSSPASPIDLLVRACARLGLDVVRTVSVALTVAVRFDLKRCPSFDGERYWSHAMLTAAAAHEFASLSASRTTIDPQAGHTAGLLHNIGLVWMANQLPAEMNAVLAMKQSEPDLSLKRLLRDQLGIDYAAAGAYLGRSWGLPDAIVMPMAHHSDHDCHDGLPATVAIVRDARAMASIQLDDEGSPLQVDKLQRLQTGETAGVVTAVREQVSARVPGIRGLAQELFAHKLWISCLIPLPRSAAATPCCASMWSRE